MLEPETTTDRRRVPLWMLFLVLLAAVVPYLPALSSGFIYDDHYQIEDNPHLRAGLPIWKAFTGSVWSLTTMNDSSNYYRPMMWVSYKTLFALAGATPWPYHLLNLLMHAGAALLLFFITRRMWGSDVTALVATLLFSTHPLHVEPVVWIADVTDAGCTLFVLTAFYLYIHNQQEEITGSFAGALAAFGVALLFKETAAAWAPIVFFYDALVMKKMRFRRYAGIAFATILYAGARMFALGGLAPKVMHADMTLRMILSNILSTLVFYGQKVFFPVHLSILYPPLTSGTVAWGAILAVTVVVGLAAWKLRGQALWAALWVLLALGPSLAAPWVAFPLADRNLYLASAGLAWLAALGLGRLGRRPAIGIAVATALVWGVLSSLRSRDWQDDNTLWASALREAPENEPVRVLLASEFNRQGRYREAIEQLDALLQRNPNNLDALTSKAGTLVALQDWPGVEKVCEKVFSVDPASARCKMDIGFAREQSGDVMQALSAFQEAYRKDPELWQALMHEGLMNIRLGHLDKAQEALEKVAVRAPSAPVLNNLGSVRAQRGDIAAAAEDFRAAIRIDPSFDLARKNLALAEEMNNAPAATEPKH